MNELRIHRDELYRHEVIDMIIGYYDKVTIVSDGEFIKIMWYNDRSKENN